MTPLELLAPAKNLACGMAAIDHGADAVYIGAPKYGARAAVGNSIGDIRKLCEYAHPYGVKIYVTLNTIVYDSELEEIHRLIDQLAEIGVDAILVQDMGLLQFLQDKPFEIHASTQTDNRTAEKVRWLQQVGFTRAVLARELSAEEIAGIHRQVPDMELEVFVHGALCVSYSGICYASQHCFQRSANRGECAQFCRMRFSLVDADGVEVERERYLLSLKDMNQSDNLEKLISAGAVSFKIEGRLKDVAYVKNVTAAYSERLNAFIRKHPENYCRASKGHCEYTFSPNLNRTFNRGYTTYFVNGRQPDIASFDTPKAVGENNDQEFERVLSKPSATRKIAITIALRAVDDGFELSAGDVSLHFAAEHLLAQKSPRENLIRQLSKLGDTIYECSEVDIPDDFNYFIPNSQLSDMRRQLVDALSMPRREVKKARVGVPPALGNLSYLNNISNHLSASFYGTDELSAFELRGGDGPIMQCRHCLRYALGYCVKHGGRRPEWHEPLSLVLGDGRRFRLEFDCQHCQMNVYASTH